MSELSPEALGLIRDAAAADDPTAGDRERIRLSLEQKLGTAAFATTIAVAGSAHTATSGMQAASAAGSHVAGTGAAAKAGALSVMSKLVLAAGVVSAVSSAVLINTRETRTPPVAALPHANIPAVITPAKAPPPTVEPKADTPEQIPEQATETIKKVRPTHPRVDPGAPSLSDELSLLNRAQEALAHGNAGQALEQAKLYMATFPTGTLHEEARAVEALSRCALGEAHDKVVAAFERQAPRSLLLGRVRSGCSPK